VGPSLILMQVCFNQAQQTCHKHKKSFVRGHTSLGYMQHGMNYYFSFSHKQQTTNVFISILQSTQFFTSSYLSLPLHHPQGRHLDVDYYGTPTSSYLMHPSKGLGHVACNLM